MKEDLSIQIMFIRPVVALTIQFWLHVTVIKVTRFMNACFTQIFICFCMNLTKTHTTQRKKGGKKMKNWMKDVKCAHQRTYEANWNDTIIKKFYCAF